MPVRQVLISNLSGAEIPAGTGARVRIMWHDAKRVDQRIDLTQEEALKLAKQFKAEEVEVRTDRQKSRG